MTHYTALRIPVSAFRRVPCVMVTSSAGLCSVLSQQHELKHQRLWTKLCTVCGKTPPSVTVSFHGSFSEYTEDRRQVQDGWTLLADIYNLSHSQNITHVWRRGEFRRIRSLFNSRVSHTCCILPQTRWWEICKAYEFMSELHLLKPHVYSEFCFTLCSVGVL